MNKHTLKQLNDLETEERFVQKMKVKQKTSSAKKPAKSAVKKKPASVTTAEKAISTVKEAPVIQTSVKTKSKSAATFKKVSEKEVTPDKAEIDEAAMDAAALDWALTVIKHNLTSEWIEEE